MKINPNPPKPEHKKQILILGIAAIIIFYNFFQSHFIGNLNGSNPQPQFFDSNNLQDLSKDIIDASLTIKHGILIQDQIIQQCEDIQVNNDGIAYCINFYDGKILTIDYKKNLIKQVGQSQTGFSYGLRLSRDQKILYFINSELGLCEFNIAQKRVKSLVSSYNNISLNSLNSIQTHPSSQVLYLSQSSTKLPMSSHHIQILLNQPNSRIFQFNLTSSQLTLLCQGLHFANGLVYQQYNGQQTLIVAETNRYRILRLFLSGQNKGQIQIVKDNLPFFIDNMKLNHLGHVWVAGPTQRDSMSYLADHHPIVRKIVMRLPIWLFNLFANVANSGGLKLTFNQDNTLNGTTNYLWKSLPTFKFVTTITQKQDNLYISSLLYKGILVIKNFSQIQNLKRLSINNKIQVNGQM